MSTSIRHHLLGHLLMALVVIAFAACSSEPLPPNGFAPSVGGSGGENGSDESGDADEDDGVGESGGNEAGICLMQNCNNDLECATCPDNKNTCDPRQGVCVACDPETGSGCEKGLVCSPYGNCVDPNLTCPLDERGTPTITCEVDGDCAACPNDHLLCVGGACVACTEKNTSACQTTEQCVNNMCGSSCPAECTTNADCGGCISTRGNEALACHDRQCAQCTNGGSEPVPCEQGEYCTDQGTCAPMCGIPGQAPGTCDNDSDCAGCDTYNKWECHQPINGGHGQCGPTAAGCNLIGETNFTLPEPFNEVTNLCDSDSDCAGVGVQYNVGKLLREITGENSIDDANINYPMNRCADVSIGEGLTCGVCVPCQYDSDCQDISIASIAEQAFGPLGGFATAILLDLLFGNNAQVIHMFCQPIAGSYGICAPCPTLLNECGNSYGGGSGGSNSCSGKCGGQAPGGCYCDEDCVSLGDCCNDYESVCGSGAGGSCQGYCGGQSPQGCYCDSQCTQMGDCCPDYSSTCSGTGSGSGSNSCYGYCGSQPPGGQCYCDSQCAQYGDCCPDYSSACGGSTGGSTGGSGAGETCAGSNCNGPGIGNCYCDDQCTIYNDCCIDYSAYCPL